MSIILNFKKCLRTWRRERFIWLFVIK